MRSHEYPGELRGTSMAESSFIPFFSPVTTWIVEPNDNSEAEFVMNIFDPLMIHLPFSSEAVVLVPRESDPAVSSVNPKAHSLSPVQNEGRSSAFCFSEPNCQTGPIPRELCDATVAACELSILDNSSTAIIYDKVSRY